MAKKLVEIEGIGASYAAKLQEAGVASQEGLLEAGGTKKGRKELEEKPGISGTLLLKWINRADLARVKGIGEEHADLLELAGRYGTRTFAAQGREPAHEARRGGR